MSAATLLDRLHAVKKCGAGRWMARCPSHEDARASLSIRALPDERILLHCFGGCDTQAVLRAVGLTFSDLFPAKLGDHIQRVRSPWSACDAINLVLTEAAVVAIVAHDILQFREPSDDDWQRLVLASQRLDGIALAVRS